MILILWDQLTLLLFFFFVIRLARTFFRHVCNSFLDCVRMCFRYPVHVLSDFPFYLWSHYIFCINFRLSNIESNTSVLVFVTSLLLSLVSPILGLFYWMFIKKYFKLLKALAIDTNMRRPYATWIWYFVHGCRELYRVSRPIAWRLFCWREGLGAKFQISHLENKRKSASWFVC